MTHIQLMQTRTQIRGRGYGGRLSSHGRVTKQPRGKQGAFLVHAKMAHSVLHDKVRAMKSTSKAACTLLCLSSLLQHSTSNQLQVLCRLNPLCLMRQKFHSNLQKLIQRSTCKVCLAGFCQCYSQSCFSMHTFASVLKPHASKPCIEVVLNSALCCYSGAASFQPSEDAESDNNEALETEVRVVIDGMPWI